MNDLNYMKLIIWYYTNKYEPLSLMQHRIDETMVPIAELAKFDIKDVAPHYMTQKATDLMSLVELRSVIKPQYHDLFDTAVLELQMCAM